MQFKEYGFGMFGWENDDVAIAGGMRDNGHHPAGKMRCIFMAYDKAKAVLEQKTAVEVAKLVLVVNLGDGENVHPTVDKFINIEIPKHLRRQGLGRRIVAGVLEAAADDLEICDIKKSARGFWAKVGAQDFLARSGLVNATIRRGPEPVPAADGERSAAPAAPAM